MFSQIQTKINLTEIKSLLSLYSSEVSITSKRCLTSFFRFLYHFWLTSLAWSSQARKNRGSELRRSNFRLPGETTPMPRLFSTSTFKHNVHRNIGVASMKHLSLGLDGDLRRMLPTMTEFPLRDGNGRLVHEGEGLVEVELEP